MAGNKPTNRERLNEITASIEQGIKELFQSGKYAEYLRTMSRFHTYSVRNTILIHMQRPDATVVAGFNAWKNKFSRHVKKGEKGITILAPTPFMKKVEEMKLDPVTKAPMLDQNGRAVIEEKEIEIPMFRPVKVFDVSQTEGKPLPQLASDLTGDVRNYEIFMEALRRTSPVPIDIKPIGQDMDGFFNLETQSITLREGMSEVQTVCAAVHEITHSLLHNQEQKRLSAAAGTEKGEQVKPKDRNTEEVEAESVSYAVCQYYGIQTGENSFGYIATWSGNKSLPELKASLDTISKTANQLISGIDRHFAEICKERGIDLTPQQETEQAAPEPMREVEVPEQQQAAPEGVPDTENAPDQPGIPSVDVTAELPEHKLDEYPMPDHQLTTEDMRSFGYADENMLPLSRDRALELLEQDATIYMLHGDNTEEMAFDAGDILAHNGYFGIERTEWEKSAGFSERVRERLDRQEEREAAFLAHEGDCFAIYQLQHGDEQRFLHYEPLERLRKAGESPRKGNYDLVYTAPLTQPGDIDHHLNDLWEQFNIAHPADYRSPSMSISDIVAIKQDGVVSCHYVDRFGFSELHGFFEKENPLKNAEMLVEDDYGMIDGIINNGSKAPTVAELEAQVKAGRQISLLDLAGAVKRERGQRQGKKPSVLGQLKKQPRQERKKPAPKKSTEREL